MLHARRGFASLVIVVSGIAGAMGCDHEPKDSPSPSSTAPPPAASSAAPSAAPSAAAVPRAGQANGVAVTPTGKMTKDKDALFTLTNKASVDVKSIGVNVYVYDHAGKNIGGSGGGASFDPPLKPGEVKESSFSCGASGTVGATTELVVNEIAYADGSKWKDSSLTPPDRPMSGKN